MLSLAYEIKKLLRNFEGSNLHFFKKLSGLDDNLLSYKKMSILTSSLYKKCTQVFNEKVEIEAK